MRTADVRILQLTDAYPPARGGVEQHVASLSRALADRGHDVQVVCLATDGRASVARDGPVLVRRVAGWSAHLDRRPGRDRRFHPPAADPGITATLRGLVADGHIDVVHAHTWIARSYLAVPGPRPPLVVTLHDYSWGCARMSLWAAGGRRCDGPGPWRCLRCAADGYGAVRGAATVAGVHLGRRRHRGVAAFVAISRAVADRAEVWGIPPTALRVIPSGVGLVAAAEQAARRPRPGFVPPSGPYLMYAGALADHKGYPVLLDAYRRAATGIPLVVAGVPVPGRPPPPAAAGVRVVYDAAHAEVLAAWAQAQVAVVPSRYKEPLGLVALEAMAAGVPVVASAVGGLRETVEPGRTGLLVPPDDPEALAAALRQLATDPAWCRRLGAAGRDRAARFDGLDRIEALYEEVALTAGRWRTGPGRGTAARRWRRSTA